jgi:signal transduction histidine kinase
MGRPLRVLILEDNPDDCALLEKELRRSGFEVTWARAASALEMREALARDRFDALVANYSLPRLPGPEALQVYRELALDIPFLLVADSMEGQSAVEAFQAGAHDYILKDRIARLGPAMHRELQEAEARQVRRRLEQEREELLIRERALRSEAERLSGLRDEFLASLSHELRTPLNAILGWSDLARAGRLATKTIEEVLELISRNAKHQAQLVDEILDVSHLITGQLRLDVRPVDVANIVVEVLETVRPTARARGVHLEKALDPDAGLVMGDPNRIQQIVRHLLSIALKSTPRGGQVTIALRRIESEAEILVRDTGRGIKPEFLPEVFEHFRQQDGSPARGYGGLGLGLSIVRRLAELHGGTVRAESSGAGQGASFFVRLPLATESLRGQPSLVEIRPEFSFESLLRGVRILVVDDDPDTRALLTTILTRHGAEPRAAGSARAGFQIFEGAPPDAAVCDLAMPGEDGLSLIRRIRAWEVETSRPPVPAIALTAYARAEDRRRALQAGFQVHLAKPVEPEELVLTIAGLLGRGGRAA